MLVSPLVRFSTEATKQAIQRLMKRDSLPGIGRIIITAGNKGGVGKSTVAVNTALALSEAGMRVGIFDGDVFSPAIPHLVSIVDNQLALTKDKKFIPIPAYGIETVSVGNGVEQDQALLWKGPFIPQLIADLLKKAAWPELDFLVIDAPPGTGDILMALNEAVPIDGAIVVTTPQAVAVAEAVRNIDCFRKFNIPVVGVVKNFDGYYSESKNKNFPLFDGEGAVDLCKKFDFELLGSIPAHSSIAKAGETGFPIFLENPDSTVSQTFRQIAKRVISKVPKREVKKEEEKVETETPVEKKEPENK